MYNKIFALNVDTQMDKPLVLDRINDVLKYRYGMKSTGYTAASSEGLVIDRVAKHLHRVVQFNSRTEPLSSDD